MSKNTGLKNSIVLYEAYPYARPIALLVAGLFIAGCSYPATNWIENIGIILGLVCILWGIIKLFNNQKYSVPLRMTDWFSIRPTKIFYTDKLPIFPFSTNIPPEE